MEVDDVKDKEPQTNHQNNNARIMIPIIPKKMKKKRMVGGTRKRQQWQIMQMGSFSSSASRKMNQELSMSKDTGKVKSLKLKLKKHVPQCLSGPDWQMSPAMQRAQELQSHLSSEFPSFIKTMFSSIVSYGFSMKLPLQFCRHHMPRQDTTVFLLDEKGNNYNTTFLAKRSSINAGWRRFPLENRLVIGDVLVFQLIKPLTFKVYIVRANNLAEIDAAISLLDLSANIGQKDCADMSQVPLPLGIIQENVENLKYLNTDRRPPAEFSKCNSENEGLGILEGNKCSSFLSSFEDVSSFSCFNVIVNGLSIDSELSEQLRAKYYELCCSHNSFLHSNLLLNIKSGLAAGIITETIEIANAINTCKISTFPNDYANWVKKLEALERLGMNVDPLRARLRQLVKIGFKSKEDLRMESYFEATLRQSCIKRDIRNLELKLSYLKKLNKKLADKLDDLKPHLPRYELRFLEEVKAPW